MIKENPEEEQKKKSSAASNRPSGYSFGTALTPLNGERSMQSKPGPGKAKKVRKADGRAQTARSGDKLAAAILLHQSGKLAAAERAYRNALDREPDNVRALYLCGLAIGQLGRMGEAIALLREAIARQPDFLPAISELARLLQENGELQESAAALRILISSRPDLGGLYSNLGWVLLQLGELEEALVACKKGVALDPDCAKAHSNLGDVLSKSGRLDEACAAYQCAIEQDPTLTHAYRRLASTLRERGRLQEAANVLKHWIEVEPDNPIARHIHAACSGQDVPKRASDAYLRSVFDNFAARYDDDLHALGYQGPRLIRREVSAELGAPVARLDILDAGCGTGLCAPSLRPAARRLVGVDISAKMVQQARNLQLYDELVDGELVDYLQGQPKRFDLIVAADTFNYFGGLEQLLGAVGGALRASGVLIFTFEKSEKPLPQLGYRLGKDGRYSHEKTYVERCVNDAGLAVRSIASATLRQERGRPVRGMIVRAKKSPESATRPACRLS